MAVGGGSRRHAASTAALLLGCWCIAGADAAIVRLRSRVIDTDAASDPDAHHHQQPESRRAVKTQDTTTAAAAAAPLSGKRHYIISAATGAVRGVGDALQAAVGHLPQFVPENSYAVYTSEATVRQLKEDHEWVVWAGPMAASDKIDPELAHDLYDEVHPFTSDTAMHAGGVVADAAEPPHLTPRDCDDAHAVHAVVHARADGCAGQKEVDAIVAAWRAGFAAVGVRVRVTAARLFHKGLPVTLSRRTDNSSSSSSSTPRMAGTAALNTPPTSCGDTFRVAVNGCRGDLAAAVRTLAAEGRVFWVGQATVVPETTAARVPPPHHPQGRTGNTTSGTCRSRDARSAHALQADTAALAAAAASLTDDPRGSVRWVVQSGVENSIPCWDNGVDGNGETVGIGDTGLDYASCYFADAENGVMLYPNSSQRHRKLWSVQPSNCECEEGAGKQGDTTDALNGKGTHHAGLIAGQQAGSPAGAFEGLARGARLFFQDLQNPALSDPSLRKIFAGTDLTAWYLSSAYSDGVRVHVSPWGTGPRLSLDDADGLGGLGPRSPVGYTNYALDADTYVWRNPDLLLLSTVGNDGHRGARATAAPGNAKNILSVGAHSVQRVPDGWVLDNVPFFTSSGPTWDGRIKPEVVLPGEDVLSVYAGRDCDTSKHSGANVAAAVGAGAATLVRQYLKQGVNGLEAIESPRADLVKGVMVASTSLLNGVKKLSFDDPEGVVLNGTWPSWQAGYGRVNLANVLRFEGSTALVQRPRMWFDDDGLFRNHAQGDYFAWCFEVLDLEAYREPLRIVLSWTDYPAALFANTALVTDLHLIVTDDTGETWKGNQDRYQDRPADNLNNIEAVHIAKPVPGRYIVQVVLAKPLVDAVVADGGQPFSVVVSGPVGLPTPAMCPLFYCPSGCSGNGECVKLPGTVMGTQVTLPTCQCAGHYTHVDCSVPKCDPADACSGNGCLEADGTCTCFADPLYGHWAGAACDVCASTHTGALPDGTWTCRVDRSCSFHGEFRVVGGGGNGTCDCQEGSVTGWWGDLSCRTCRDGYYGASCRCGSAYCSGHGRCGAEGCMCQESDATGYWAAALRYHDCSICADGWFGEGCKCSNATCSGHGTCTLNGCVCDDSEATGRWQLVDATCNICKTGWTGPGCNCKEDLTAMEVCGGHGYCTSVAGCECHQNTITGYWGSASEGVCDVCDGGFGANCLCKDANCGNHGTCTDFGCVCDDTDAAGHWMQVDSTCEVCKPGWYGDGCRCQSSDCDLHGTCMQFGCDCYQTWVNSDPAKVGYFDGDGSRCNKCRGGWSVYPYCLCETEDCNGHGRCTPNGCACQEADVENGIGAYASEDPLIRKDCLVCAEGYSGSDCTCGRVNCAQEYNSGTAFERQFNIHRHFYANTTYNASVTVRADAEGIVKQGSGQTVEMMFKRVENSVQAHPRKAGPGELIFMENAWIMETYLRERVGSQNRTISTSSVRLESFMVVEGEWRETMEFGVKANPSSVTLYVLTPQGWEDASSTCPADVRQRVSDEGFFQTRVCTLYNGAIYALFAEERIYVNHMPVILGTVFAIVTAVAVLAFVGKKVKDKIDNERRAKEAKNQIIQFMQRRKNEPSLRQRLGLGEDADFTPEFAAQKLLQNLKKKRGLFALLMKRTEFRKIQQLTEAMVGAKMTGDSRENIAALAALTDGEKPIKKIWEFREGELNLLEACRLVRGMVLDSAEAPSAQEQRFGEEVKLRPDSLAPMHKELVETKAENVKLRRIVHALQLADIRTDASGVMLQPKQSLYPPGAAGNRNVKAVPPSLLKSIAAQEGRSAKTVNFKQSPPEDNLHGVMPGEGNGGANGGPSE